MKKLLSIVLTLASVLAFQASSMPKIHKEADMFEHEVVSAKSIGSYLLNPETNEYVPVRDLTAEVKIITEENADNTIKSRPKPKRELETNISRNNIDNPPVPGGVGYGVYYNTSFMQAYNTGTTLAYDIICPTVAGGDVNDFLYLTATNRAAKGCEAYISYYAQNNPEFVVFDWARTSDWWQITMPYSSLSNYLDTRSISGSSYQIVSVQNSTQELSPGTWINYVWLYNYNLNTYDLIYHYSYSATLSDQYGAFWGPIVETFQDSYTLDTNVLGFNNCYMMSKNNNTWGSWELLASNNSYIVTENIGFTTVFMYPYYTWGVH